MQCDRRIKIAAIILPHNTLLRSPLKPKRNLRQSGRTMPMSRRERRESLAMREDSLEVRRISRRGGVPLERLQERLEERTSAVYVGRV